jgi:hypothetical protein
MLSSRILFPTLKSDLVDAFCSKELLNQTNVDKVKARTFNILRYPLPEIIK